MPKKDRPEKQPETAAEVVPDEELESVRQQEKEEKSKADKPNVIINSLNVFAGPVRSFMDPVKKVCYPRLEAHWETKYKKRSPKHAGKLLAFDLALLFMASALAVLLVLVHTSLPPIISPGLVTASLPEPQTLPIGESSELVIEYQNNQGKLVQDARIVLETPDSFVLARTDALESSRNRVNRQVFELGELPANSSGQITVPGRAYGTPDSTLPVTLKMIYWEGGRAADTVIYGYYSIPLVDSPLALDISFSEPFMTDTVNRITVSYENRGDAELSNTRVRLKTPDGFRVVGAEPYLGSNMTWQPGNLSPGQHGTLAVYGILTDGAAPDFAVTATVDAHEQEALKVNRAGRNAHAKSTGFVLTQDLAGLTSLRPGQEATVTVRYANRGEKIIRNVAVNLDAEGAYLAESYPAPEEWTADGYAELEKLEPGADGEFTATVRTAEYRGPEELNGNSEPHISVTSHADYSLSGDDARMFRTQTGTIDLPITTSLNLDTAALYFTEAGDQLGVGPIPPKVGKVTRLWAVITVENRHNPVSDAVLTATLMPGVTWTGKTSVTSGKPLAYVPSERKVIWQIDEIPAYAGEHLPSATANFEVGVAPDENDAGSVLELLDHINIEGKDAFTDLRVTASGEPVTTAIRFGEEESLVGKVVE